MPSDLRGLLFNFHSISAIFSSAGSLKSVPLGMYWRSSPFVFSLAPRSQVFYYEYLLAGFYNELLSRCKYYNLFFHIHFHRRKDLAPKPIIFRKCSKIHHRSSCTQ